MIESQRPRLTPILAAEINKLNARQRAAVLCEENATVLAGPGSGKTRVLVAKAAYLAASSVRTPQRVACLTYGNLAADEIRNRLRTLTLGATRSVTVSTVHGFCLSEVLIPFSSMTGYGKVSTGAVLGSQEQRAFRASAYQSVGLYEDPTYTDSRDIACRRIVAARGDLSRFSARVIAAAKAYEDLLASTGRLDFEFMVSRSLQILRQRPSIVRILATRFPWILVDEYQDLGPVLHCLITILRDAGVNILAAGDPDQSILGFTGSDPRYLIEFSKSSKVHTLSVNYRSGRAIIAASSKVLGINRGYQPRDDADEGLIDYQPEAGGIGMHAEKSAELVRELISAGVAPHEIAVLYSRNRKKVPAREWLEAALKKAGVPLLAERALPWPSGLIVRLLQRAATWQLERRHPSSSFSAKIRFEDLVEDYLRLRSDRYVPSAQRLPFRVNLWRFLSSPVAPEAPLKPWLVAADESLELRQALRRNLSSQEAAAFSDLQSTKFANVSLAEFSGDAKSIGKVRLTTYFSAKGREWSYVVLPYLQEAITPDWPLDYGRPYLPGQLFVEQERRAFYVAFSRAKKAVVLVYTPDGFTGERTPLAYRTPSRFLWDMPGFPD
ncbi:ATP-dependent helicase [Micromonospora haikouensis]|uniref:ATP-dependent helicase n=1 Tax=Micromonospora haikouensis TaxID=686309 RepID=UPI00378CFDC1